MGRVIAIAVMSGVAATASAQPSLTALGEQSADESGTVGVMTDVGVPDGATASLVVRPTRALRFEAGLAHNYISPGYRASVTYIPFASWATPVLSIGYGTFLERDANSVAKQIDPTFTSPVLEKVGYDFANARVGLELGKKYFTFFIHAGVSRVTGTVHNLDQVVAAQTASDSTITVTSTDPKVTLWGASANLGFIFYVH